MASPGWRPEGFAMTFDSWLRKQRDRDDPIGDLAQDYIADCRQRKVRYRSIRSLYRDTHGIRDVFDDALEEYRLARASGIHRSLQR
jgi:hypothetical protein